MAAEQMRLGDSNGALATATLLPTGTEREQILAEILLDKLKRQGVAAALKDFASRTGYQLSDQGFWFAITSLLDDKKHAKREVIVQAQLLIREIQDPLIRAAALRSLAQGQASVGRRDEARATLKEAVALLNRSASSSSDISEATDGHTLSYESGTRDPSILGESGKSDGGHFLSWKVVLAAAFAGLGFVIGGLLKPVLEALGKAFIGKALAEALKNPELGRALGAPFRGPTEIGPSPKGDRRHPREINGGDV